MTTTAGGAIAARTITAGLVAGLIVSACAGIGARDDIATEGSTGGLNPVSSAGAKTCPVTVPRRHGFVPPEPYPPEAPYGQVWFGAPGLWTILDSNGAVWRGLPVGTGPHAIGDKTLWFSEHFSTAEGEDFSGDADITLTAVRLDGSARTVVQEGGQPSFNRDIMNFLLVPLGVPKPGCWEVTASYKTSELTYVFEVED
jgi:hypothetical protein